MKNEEMIYAVQNMLFEFKTDICNQVQDMIESA